MDQAFPGPKNRALGVQKWTRHTKSLWPWEAAKTFCFVKKNSRLHALGVARNSLDHCRKWVLDTDPAKHASSPLYYTISNYITLYYTASDTFFSTAAHSGGNGCSYKYARMCANVGLKRLCCSTSVFEWCSQHRCFSKSARSC